jgi:hypothetical protein
VVAANRVGNGTLSESGTLGKRDPSSLPPSPRLRGGRKASSRQAKVAQSFSFGLWGAGDFLELLI